MPVTRASPAGRRPADAVAGIRADDVAAVVVDAEEVDRLRRSSAGRRSPIAGSMRPEALERLGRVLAAQDRVEEPAVAEARPRAARRRRPSGRVDAGCIGIRSSVMPTSASGTSRRSTCDRPAVGEEHVVAGGDARRPRSCGRARAARCRSRARRSTQGSFCVIQWRTRSPRRAATTSVYSANASTVSRAGQPPRSSSACGRSQW